MPRALWKGAIAFGLVHIPVSIHPASTREGLDFDWLDKRDMSPVGYKRINKETGKEVTRENIVKGLAVESGRYAVLTDAEIKAANPKATQTIDIVAFVGASEVPPGYFEAPYFVAPEGRGEKVYALLRETLLKQGKIGIALVVLHTKQHLAALIPGERELMMVTLRWATEMRSADELELPAAGTKATGLREKELAMATQLVKDMTEPWKPEQYRDQFRDDILALVKRKVAKKQTKVVEKVEARKETPSNVIDLTELLRNSLAKRKPAAATKAAPAAKAARKKPAAALRKRA